MVTVEHCADKINIEKENMFLVKKAFDVIVSIMSYVVLVSNYDMIVYIKQYNEYKLFNIIYVVSIILNVYNIIDIFKIQVKQLPLLKSLKEFKKVKYDRDNFAIVISVFCIMFFEIASIYFLIYVFNNQWYNIDGCNRDNIWEVAFEFVYFTFSVTFTYSGSGLTAIGIIPKIIQMLHVMFFYFWAADIIFGLLKDSKDI